MLGTLGGALEVRGIKLETDAIGADAEGINEIEGGVPLLKAIHIRYRLRIPPGSRETVERALSRHQSKCPTAASLAPAVKITWEAAIAESG